MSHSENFKRWAQQAADQMENDMEMTDCPECKETHFAPAGHDPLKRGCYSCGWNQD